MKLNFEMQDSATKRFFDFFTANIRSRNTREAYHRALVDFFAWCGDRGFQLFDVETIVVAAYVEYLAALDSAQTLLQRLALSRIHIEPGKRWHCEPRSVCSVSRLLVLPRPTAPWGRSLGSVTAGFAILAQRRLRSKLSPSRNVEGSGGRSSDSSCRTCPARLRPRVRSDLPRRRRPEQFGCLAGKEAYSRHAPTHVWTTKKEADGWDRFTISL